MSTPGTFLHLRFSSTPAFARQLESLMETLVAVGLLIVVNVAFFPDDPGYLNVSPHPFLFLTILVASRYGTFDGFLAGFLCAIVYLCYLLFGQDLGTAYKSFEWTQALPAYLFVILGLLLGEIRELANRDVKRLRLETGELAARLESSTKENQDLVKVKEELQGLVLSADDPLAEFYDSARRLSTLRPEEAYPAIMDLVGRFTGAEKFALYLEEPAAPAVAGKKPPRNFRLKVSRGWVAPEEFDSTLEENLLLAKRSASA